MLPFKHDVAPAVAGVLCNGEPHPRGVVATLIELASQNYLSLHEQEMGRWSFRIQGTDADQRMLTGSKKALLHWLIEWEHSGMQKMPFERFRQAWVDELGREMTASRTIEQDNWAVLRRQRLFPLWTHRYLPPELHNYWKDVARQMRHYPTLKDPLPETRLEWDTLLAYATALGQGELFLRNVRRVCEYYETRFEGIVMTFYTPHWFIHHRAQGEERFAFLTEGLAELVSNPDWSKFHPLEVARQEVEA
jgi:hypothetical protein